MYTGIKEVILTDEELADFYSDKLRFDLETNQYLLIKNSNKDIVDKFKFDGSKMVKIKFRAIESQILGKIKPRNIKQELFCDLLDSNIPVKVVSGIAGSGKTFLSTAWSLQEIQRGNYNKLIVIKNNVLVQNVTEIGALPGDANDKLRSNYAFISDIVSNDMFDVLMQQNRLEMAYLGTMRGRSLSESIVLVSEAQNLTTALVKMIVTRVGEKSTLIFDFDLDQIDKKAFNDNNGMLAITESLKGNPLFGMVEFDMIERSEVAKLAELIK